MRSLHRPLNDSEKFTIDIKSDKVLRVCHLNCKFDSNCSYPICSVTNHLQPHKTFLCSAK
jgi:hypothetical protein